MSRASGRYGSVVLAARPRSRSAHRIRETPQILPPVQYALVPEDQDAECIICYEAVGALGGAVALPCNCKCVFCHTCWDRSLAASISACGLARCPSCRCPMRVDFNISLNRLVFSKALDAYRDYGYEYTWDHDDWQRRLYQQAKPTQIRLLRQYGGRMSASLGGVAVRPWGPWPRALDAPPNESHDSSASSSDSDRSPSPPSSSVVECATDGSNGPRCVCGSSLHHISVQERVRVFVTEEARVPPPQHFVERLLASPPIFCDICDRRLGPTSGVWTCENGGRTVLHAAAYDVCEACFAFHVHGDMSLAISSYRDPSRLRRKGGRIGT